MTSGDIADKFSRNISAGRLLDKSTYYQVQRECLAAIPDASPNARVVLFCAAQLAAIAARELEDDAIDAEMEGNWHVFADMIEKALRLPEEKSAQEVLWALSKAIAVMSPAE